MPSGNCLPAYTASGKPDGSRLLTANGCVHNGCVHFTVKNPRHGVALRSTFSPLPSNCYELMICMAAGRSAAQVGVLSRSVGAAVSDASDAEHSLQAATEGGKKTVSPTLSSWARLHFFSLLGEP